MVLQNLLLSPVSPCFLHLLDHGADRLSLLQSEGRRLLSVPQAARYLGIKPKTIYNGTGLKSGKKFPVPFKRYGRKILFDIRDLEKFADEL